MSASQVGPIPIEDGIGKEIVTQIKSTVGNNKTFYTDSNGRDFLERVGCIHSFLPGANLLFVRGILCL